MSSNGERRHAGVVPDLAGAQAVAKWSGLPCETDRARRLLTLFEAQRQRMQRFYDEDVGGYEFDFLKPDDPDR